MRILIALLTCTLAVGVGCNSEGPGGKTVKCTGSDDACPENSDDSVDQSSDPVTAEDGGTPAPDGGSQPNSALGCNGNDDCASGDCNEDGECTSCLDDQECNVDHVCGTFECGRECGGKGDPSCGAGSECCGQKCVDIQRDVANCGGCNIACSPTQFCGVDGCTQVSLANLCKTQSATIILNDLSGDDAESKALKPKLIEACSPAIDVNVVNQTKTDLLNPVTGQPFAGGNNLLVAVGGTFGHHLVSYLETQQIAPIYGKFVEGKPNAFEYRQRGSHMLIAKAIEAEETETAGYFLIEVVREPQSGSLVLVAYGYRAGGTAAAAWFLENRMLPSLSTFTESWYMFKWASTNADPRPDADDTFTPVISGC